MTGRLGRGGTVENVFTIFMVWTQTVARNAVPFLKQLPFRSEFSYPTVARTGRKRKTGQVRFVVSKSAGVGSVLCGQGVPVCGVKTLFFLGLMKKRNSGA